MRASVRNLDFGLAGKNDLATLRAHLHLQLQHRHAVRRHLDLVDDFTIDIGHVTLERRAAELCGGVPDKAVVTRSEEHTSELQSLMRISYAVFCLKKQNHKIPTNPLCQHKT